MSWTPEIDTDTACANASDFLHQLTSLSGHLATQLATTQVRDLRFLYRGVSDSSHRLVPTALRAADEHFQMHDTLWKIHDGCGRPVSIESRELEVNQRRAELKVIQQFYQNAERAGLSLPVLPNNIRTELLTGQGGTLEMAVHGHKFNPVGGVSETQWPPIELLPIAGLAQHYGLPTRLLDWSYSPLVSGYFAASGGLQRLVNGDDPKSKIAVWATFANSFESFGTLDTFEHGKRTVETFPSRLVQPATADNPNLSLQRGVFTVLFNENKIENTDPVDRRTLPEALKAFQESSTELLQNQKMPAFLKLQLSIEETPQLMHALKNLGYSANRIFDGFPGAAAAAKETANSNILLMAAEKANSGQT